MFQKILEELRDIRECPKDRWKVLEKRLERNHGYTMLKSYPKIQRKTGISFENCTPANLESLLLTIEDIDEYLDENPNYFMKIDKEVNNENFIWLQNNYRENYRKYGWQCASAIKWCQTLLEARKNCKNNGQLESIGKKDVFWFLNIQTKLINALEIDIKEWELSKSREIVLNEKRKEELIGVICNLYTSICINYGNLIYKNWITSNTIQYLTDKTSLKFQREMIFKGILKIFFDSRIRVTESFITEALDVIKF